jgi:hypothetical protein
LTAFAKYGRALYVLVFIAAGSYASLLLLTSMWGWQNAGNTLIYACGILFIVRAVFASRAAIARLRGADLPAGPRRTSDTFFAIGDGIALGSLACTALLLSTGDYRLATPVVPFGMGLAGAYLFYLIAVFTRLTNK